MLNCIGTGWAGRGHPHGLSRVGEVTCRQTALKHTPASALSASARLLSDRPTTTARRFPGRRPTPRLRWCCAAICPDSARRSRRRGHSLLRAKEANDVSAAEMSVGEAGIFQFLQRVTSPTGRTELAKSASIVRDLPKGKERLRFPSYATLFASRGYAETASAVTPISRILNTCHIRESI